MPYVTTQDGVSLYYEETGSGVPILFVHEFAGDYRAWEPQLRRFSRTHRCVTYSARGFLPSDVPEDTGAYSQDVAVRDAIAVLDALEIEKAHVVGLSMGGFTVLHLARLYADRLLSVLASAVGFGCDYERRHLFADEESKLADLFEREG